MEEPFLSQHKKFQREWLIAKEEESLEDEYVKAILETTKEIIDTQDYSWLFDVLCCYDRLFKFKSNLLLKSNNSNKNSLPFWKQNS